MTRALGPESRDGDSSTSQAAISYQFDQGDNSLRISPVKPGGPVPRCTVAQLMRELSRAGSGAAGGVRTTIPARLR